MRQAFDVGFSAEEQAQYREAFLALDGRIDAAAREPDRPVSALLEPGGRWNPLLDAFSGFYNGAPFDEISIHDYAAYDDTGSNWRVREGYGTAVAAYGAGLPVALATPVTAIRHSGARLRLETPGGEVEARAAVVCVPPSMIAEGRLRFLPDLPDKGEAAFALPLGHVDKAFLGLAEAQAFPADTHLFGRIDTALTASYHLRPFGRPLIEVFIGGELAAQLEQAGASAFDDFAVEELVNLLGSDMRHKLAPVAGSNWGQDPWTRGAYSHARPGQAGARAVLAAPVEERLFFAGEACSAHHFSTAHGAYLTGVAAAEAALASLGNRPGS
jgi:monoamine oxidase